MIDQLAVLFNKLALPIQQLNAFMYYPIRIDTTLPLLILLMFPFLYFLIHAFYADKKLTGFEFLILMAVYSFCLGYTLLTYVDMARLMESINPGSLVDIIMLILSVAVVFVLVVISAYVGEKEYKEDEKKKVMVRKVLIFTILSLPMLLLILTNGRILEKREKSLLALFPKSSYFDDFVPVFEETGNLVLGGVLEEEDIIRVENILKKYKLVNEAAVIGRQDVDGLVKIMALVELKIGLEEVNKLNQSEHSKDKLIRRLKDHFADELEEYQIPEDEFPKDIKFISAKKMEDIEGRRLWQAERVLKTHPGVKDCIVVRMRSGSMRIPVAFAVMKNKSDENPVTRLQLFRYLLHMNNLSECYLFPKWFQFMGPNQIPKDKDNKVDRIGIQRAIEKAIMGKR